jgi:hypothetical protein
VANNGAYGILSAGAPGTSIISDTLTNNRFGNVSIC